VFDGLLASPHPPELVDPGEFEPEPNPEPVVPLALFTDAPPGALPLTAFNTSLAQ
jgi:hypothetical protein